jgi:hypothetical protein
MILHAASIAAFFVDQTPQAQCVVQCIQAAPDSWLKWLLPTIVQTVISLASITAGVWIAVASFRANKRAEHEQWARDQKKAEWNALLHGVANVFHITNFTTLNGWNGKIADRIATELEQALEEISIACANCIFLDNFRQNKEGDKKVNEFLKNTKLQVLKLKGNLDLFDSQIDEIHNADSEAGKNNKLKDFDRNRDITSDLIFDLAKQSRTLLDWLQNEAALDLWVTEKGKEHQAAGRLTKLFNFTRKKTEI